MLFFRYFPQALHVKFSFIVVYSRQTRSKVVMMAALQTLLLLNCSRQNYGGFKGTYMYFSFFFSLLATCELQVATRELLLITCDLLPASSDMLLATIASCHLLFRVANCYLRVATHGFFFFEVRVNQHFILFIHHIWGETVIWGAVFIIQISDKMQYLTIFQDKLNPFNIQNRTKHAWAFSKTVQKISKITYTASRFSLLTSAKFSVNIKRVTLQHNKEFTVFIFFI